MTRLMITAGLKLFAIFCFCLYFPAASAQSWMPGFNYRKTISINKAQVSGKVNLSNFTMLLSVTDPDLKYIAGQCSANKVASRKGLDISFATQTEPGNPIKFQLESYDPLKGTLICYLNIPSLSSSGSSTAGTILYLYYGSNQVHDSNAANAVATWAEDLYRLWHMNPDVPPASVYHVKSHNLSEAVNGTAEMSADNFVQGKVGKAIRLNGRTEMMTAGPDTSTVFTISAWIKLNRTDLEQVVMTSDSAGVGGYSVRISGGKFVFETRKNSVLLSTNTSTILQPDQWYYLVMIRDGRTRNIYLNGKISTSASRTDAVGHGGSLVIGRSKQNDRYFGGFLDEIRIIRGVRNEDWIRTEYNNQSDPAGFYTIGPEERAPLQVPVGYCFNGAINQSWKEAGNWNLHALPEDYDNVIVQAGKLLNLDGVPEVKIGTLAIEKDAVLNVFQKMEIACNTRLEFNGSLALKDNAELQLDAGISNDGTILSDPEKGSIRFAGNGSSMRVYGSGNIRVSQLIVDMGQPDYVLNIEQQLNLLGSLHPLRGVLRSNGNLTLEASGTRSAFVASLDAAQASISGVVQVEKYITGSFPAPATARGWRLWSSPVYHTETEGLKWYNLQDIQQAVFVTGKGGVQNGFDASPQNGNTIYSHDQSIAGTLSQKYVPIANMNVQIPLGKGIYVFSRGSRSAIDAYKNQIQTAPFVNPEPYRIVYRGALFSGDLTVGLNNRNQAEAGDGFNLLANPYPAPIRWGSLLKENTGPFIWLFNPLNNAYDVTDDPDLMIPTGAGFFVKVNSGTAKGSVTFTEASKPASLINSAEPFKNIASLSAVMDNSNSNRQRKLEITLQGGAFSQKYLLKLSAAGSDDTDDEDAVAIGEGFVNISGIGTDQVKLAVDSRELSSGFKEIPLFVKGWSTGSFELNFSGIENFEGEYSLELLDNYLHKSTVLSIGKSRYPFEINTDFEESQGSSRFVLQIKPVSKQLAADRSDAAARNGITAYPNPVNEVLNIKYVEDWPDNVGLVLRDLMGNIVLSRNIPVADKGGPLTLNAGMLRPGLYLLEVNNQGIGRRMSVLKIKKL